MKNEITCKGSYALGTACGECYKCLHMDPCRPKNSDSSEPGPKLTKPEQEISDLREEIVTLERIAELMNTVDELQKEINRLKNLVVVLVEKSIGCNQ